MAGFCEYMMDGLLNLDSQARINFSGTHIKKEDKTILHLPNLFLDLQKFCKKYTDNKDELDDIFSNYLNRHPKLIKYIENPSKRLREQVIVKYAKAIKYFKKQSDELCLRAVKIDGRALRYVRNKTEYICQEAVIQNGEAIKYVEIEDRSEELIDLALSSNGIAIAYVENPTVEQCQKALRASVFCETVSGGNDIMYDELDIRRVGFINECENKDEVFKIYAHSMLHSHTKSARNVNVDINLAF